MIKVLWTQCTALVQAMGKRNLERTPHSATTTHTDTQDAPFAPDILLTLVSERLNKHGTPLSTRAFPSPLGHIVIVLSSPLLGTIVMNQMMLAMISISPSLT